MRHLENRSIITLVLFFVTVIICAFIPPLQAHIEIVLIALTIPTSVSLAGFGWTDAADAGRSDMRADEIQELLSELGVINDVRVSE